MTGVAQYSLTLPGAHELVGGAAYTPDAGVMNSSCIVGAGSAKVAGGRQCGGLVIEGLRMYDEYTSGGHGCHALGGWPDALRGRVKGDRARGCCPDELLTPKRLAVPWHGERIQPVGLRGVIALNSGPLQGLRLYQRTLPETASLLSPPKSLRPTALATSSASKLEV